MSEYATRSVASIIHFPTGEVLIHPDTIARSLKARGMGSVAIGMADRFQRENELDEAGVAYVDMNGSGRLELEADQIGIIATSSLSGCTGVAGFAKRVDGSTVQFISHYDPICQNGLFTGEDSPVNSDLYGFRYQATKKSELAGLIRYVVAYENSEHSNPDYGKRNGEFKTWRYLDQIQVTATQLGPNAEILLFPYSFYPGHNIAAGRIGGKEGIFWDGVNVDFDEYLHTAVPSSKSTSLRS
ncbi:hypothetical protein BVY00_00110 [bacterium G20]|nr:hypothetical protein BVY00_00110 [bacterium G20]